MRVLVASLVMRSRKGFCRCHDNDDDNDDDNGVIVVVDDDN